MTTNAISLPPVDIIPFVKKPVYKSLTPRSYVLIDGFRYTPLKFEVTQNAHGATDTASVSLPIQGYPDWTMTLLRDDELGNANKPVAIEIWADPMGTGQYVQRFSGLVDSYEGKLEEDLTDFTCRSKAAKLTSDKITTPFGSTAGITDQSTTVAYVQQLAAQYGLGTPVITLAPSQQPGTMLDVLGSEFVTGVRNWVKWDLLLQCAQYDDVDVWVDKSGVLHYEAASFVGGGPNKRPKLQYVWGENIKSLKTRHAPQFSKNVRVEVRSYVPRTVTSTTARSQSLAGGGLQTETTSRVATGSPVFGTTTVVTTSIDSAGNTSVTSRTVTGGASSSGQTKFSTESGLERYIFYVKNKTPQQCNAMAQQIWRQISMHEYSISLVAPVTVESLATMDITALIELYGTPWAAFNVAAGAGYGQYWPRSIRETYDAEQGWFWEIEAVNHTLPQGAV